MKKMLSKEKSMRIMRVTVSINGPTIKEMLSEEESRRIIEEAEEKARRDKIARMEYIIKRRLKSKKIARQYTIRFIERYSRRYVKRYGKEVPESLLDRVKKRLYKNIKKKYFKTLYPYEMS